MVINVTDYRCNASAAIGRLVGTPCTEFGRAADLVWVLFGNRITWHNHAGKATERSEFALHVQCPFRITRDNDIVLGSADLDEVIADEDRVQLNTDRAQVTVFDSKAADLNSSMGLSRVTRAVVSSVGDVVIDLESGLALHAFVVSSVDSEAWRLLSFADPQFTFVFPEDNPSV